MPNKLKNNKNNPFNSPINSKHKTNLKAFNNIKIEIEVNKNSKK